MTETDVPVAESAEICGATQALCECVLPSGHDGAHRCDEGCGGSWTFDGEGNLAIVSFPSGVPGAGRRRYAPLLNTRPTMAEGDRS